MVGLSQKLDKLIPRLGYFNVLSWFEDWLSKALDLRDVLTVRVTIIPKQSSLVDDLFG